MMIWKDQMPNIKMKWMEKLQKIEPKYQKELMKMLKLQRLTELIIYQPKIDQKMKMKLQK